MADLVRATIARLETAEGRESLVALMTSFEDAYGRDEGIDNLNASGFVENLPFPYENGADMLPLLEPNLRADFVALFSGHDIPPSTYSS